MDIKQLGPYRIGRMLGRGGMGTVYLGNHESTAETVAIKVLSPTYAKDEAFRERFEAEVHSLEKLQHPNIVKLLGFGQQYGYHFFAMEYVEGTTLQQELAAGRRFHWREVIRYGIAICHALKHAHDHGVIHRDIKPANLLLTPDEEIKLTDFGIAKLFGNSQMTADGGVLGTADYMAPEQAEGAKVTTRCDLYSVGAVLYALLSGSPPFQGKSLPEVVHKVRFEHPVPIGRLVSDVPHELDLLLGQLLDKDPNGRVPTALALANRLQAIQHALSVERTADDMPEEPDLMVQTEVVGWLDENADDDQRATRLTNSPLAAPPPSHVPQTLNTMETQVPASPSSGVESTASDVPPVPGLPPSYVSVDDEYRSRKLRRAEQRETVRDQIIKWGGVTGFAAIIGWLLWLIFKPATADQLYDKVTQTVARYGDDGVVQLEEELHEFQSRFPEDARAPEIEAWLDTLELVKLERRLRMRARYDSADESQSPLELTLIRILYLERADPRAAAAQLRALLDVYGKDNALSPHDQDCIELAEQWLARLDPHLSAANEALRKMIRRRLVYAAQIAPHDPARAAEIRRGIVELYGDQDWATDLSSEAQAQLP